MELAVKKVELRKIIVQQIIRNEKLLKESTLIRVVGYTLECLSDKGFLALDLDLNKPKKRHKTFCVYDMCTPATSLCEKCTVGLCNSCGYIVGGKKYCNSCYVRYFCQDNKEDGHYYN